MKRTLTPSSDQVTPVRELAQRRSGTLEVLLLWHAKIDLVELSVRDSATGGGFHTEVAPGRAIDAFYHPWIYAPETDLGRGAGEAA